MGKRQNKYAFEKTILRDTKRSCTKSVPRAVPNVSKESPNVAPNKLHGSQVQRILNRFNVKKQPIETKSASQHSAKTKRNVNPFEIQPCEVKIVDMTPFEMNPVIDLEGLDFKHGDDVPISEVNHDCPVYRDCKTICKESKLNFHSTTVASIRDFIDQPDVKMMLVVGPHGAGKSWCVQKALKDLDVFHIDLVDQDPDTLPLAIQTALLQRPNILVRATPSQIAKGKTVLVVDGLECYSKHFVDLLVASLKRMLFPFIESKRKTKTVDRIHIVPNRIIFVAVDQYHKRTQQIIRPFGIISGKVTGGKGFKKPGQECIQLITCAPLTNSELTRLLEHADPTLRNIDNFLLMSSDANYLLTQLDWSKRISRSLEYKPGKIDSCSNLNLFKVAGTILQNRRPVPKAEVFDKLDQQWSIASDRLPGMIQASYLKFTSNLTSAEDMSDLYSMHDCMPHDFQVRSGCDLECDETLRDSYFCMIQFGIRVLVKDTKYAKLDMFDPHSFDKFHFVAPWEFVETCQSIAGFSREMQSKRLHDLNMEKSNEYSFQDMDFYQVVRRKEKTKKDKPETKEQEKDKDKPRIKGKYSFTTLTSNEEFIKKVGHPFHIDM